MPPYIGKNCRLCGKKRFKRKKVFRPEAYSISINRRFTILLLLLKLTCYEQIIS